MYSGLAGAFILADLPGGSRASYVDNQLDAQITEQPEETARLGLAWEAVRGRALPLGMSLDMLKEATETWK